MVAAARAVIVVVSITSENESMKRSFCCMLFLARFWGLSQREIGDRFGKNKEGKR
jgi:hypothetical protein